MEDGSRDADFGKQGQKSKECRSEVQVWENRSKVKRPVQRLIVIVPKENDEQGTTVQSC